MAHHYGLERNAVEFLGGDPARAKYRPAFRTAAHVMHWGHLPLSYAGEEALLRAAHVNPDVNATVTKLIDEVARAGDLQCEEAGHDCIEAVRSGELPFELYRWIAASLVRRDWKKVWNAIKAASSGPAPDEKETRGNLIRALVCREDRGYKILSRCNQADYVARDLLQAGTAWLTVDLEALWEPNPLGSDAAREWSLIDAAQRYLDERFFHVPESLLTHSLAARAIAGGLLADRPTTATITALTGEADDYFVTRLTAYHRRRLTDVQTLAVAGRIGAEWFHVGSFSDVSLNEGSRLDMEDQLTGRSGTARVAYPFTSGISVIVESRTSRYPDFFAGAGRRYGAVHIHHRMRASGRLPAVRRALDVVAEVSTLAPPSTEVGDQVMTWLLASRVEQRCTAIERTAGEIAEAQGTAVKKHLARILALRSFQAAAGHGLLNGLLHAALDDAVGMQPQPRGELLLRMPWPGLKSASGVALFELLREGALARAISGSSEKRGYALELAVAADQWLATGNPKHRFVFLGSTLLGKDGQPVQEWDTVRVDLVNGNEWQVTAIECAINRSAAKDSEARDRLELLREHLNARFSDLTTYRTLLATATGRDLVYEDAGRGFAPV